MKVAILYWITDKVCMFRTQKLDSGIIKIKKKTFQVDKSQPYFYVRKKLLGGQKVFPMYMLKHNTPYPLQVPSGKKLQYSSENITNLLELKTLDNILKPPETRKVDTIMFILVGVIMGALISAILFLTKMIPVQ